MTLLNVLRRWRLVAIAILASCAGIAALGIWRAGGSPIANAGGEQSEKQKFQDRIRKGVGNEVRFATGKDSEDGIKASIESVARFIHNRSNMTMSDETKSDLLKAETETLRGKRARISLDSLTDSLNAIAADRAATLTDKEIESAANTFRPTYGGQISLRMSGKWGLLPKDDFVKDLIDARDWKRSGDSALDSGMRPLFAAEVNDRAANLSAAMPEHFSRIGIDGVTPVQAVVITYSVVADDALADSQSDLARQTIQERMSGRLTRAAAKAQRLNSPTPYGSNGFFHASPVYLLFNRTTVQRLLNPAEGGKAK